MGLSRFLLVVGALAGGLYLWNGHKVPSPVAESLSERGFVQTVMVDGARPNVVRILGSSNCTAEQAREGERRAAELSGQLTQMGIPNEIAAVSFSVSMTNASTEEKARAERAVEVFKQGPPIVFINGMAKSNPSAEDVAHEYRRTKSL